MALTKEILNSNPMLSGLSDEQKLAITTLSENDENAIIGARFRETYNRMDETIQSALGVQRNGDEKTYNYLERAAKVKAEELKALTEKVRGLEADKAQWEKQKGDPTETERALTQARADLDAMKKSYNTLKAKADADKAQFDRDIFGMKVDTVIDSAKAGLKLKEGVNGQIASLAIQSAIAKVKSYSPSFEDDGMGGKVLMFHNQDGSTMNNVENQLKPFTASELLARELSAYDILDNGKPKAGTGGSGPQPKGGSTLGAATQEQAVTAIHKSLASKGLVKGTMAYQKAYDQMYDDNKVSELPMQ